MQLRTSRWAGLPISRERLTLMVSSLVLAVLGSCASVYAQPKNDQPDFTKGESIPEGATHDWNLGATGARGWMYSERLETSKARQVYITKVEKDSPADGVLAVGDVLLGVGGKRFAYDPRTEIGKALTAAESEAGNGKLTLLRWRDGRAQTVALRLRELGDYSDTAPYDCEKSTRIYEQGCMELASQMILPNYRRNPIERSLNALALLASGEEKYGPLLEREANWAASFKTNGFSTWWYGYVLMYLAEYTMATGDTQFMPGLERITMEAVNGQSLVGSWGHRFANENGRLNGYGMMNAPGLTLTTGLVLAREAGVDSPKLDEAIEKSTRLLRFYVGKGSIPYGDHAPWIQTHDDNGKNGVAAVLFNLLGERETAEYFSRMSVACHGAERDTGHTGNFFNILWSLPGVNVSGKHATGAWMKEFGAWYFDLARQHDATFVHLGPPEERPDKYGRWDCTGAYLLAYAMPLKKIRLTGKGPSSVSPLTRAEAQSLIEDGRGWSNNDRHRFYDELTNEQLFDRLSSWSPVVRERAGMALGRRKDLDAVPKLVELLGEDDLYTRRGASQALKFVRGDRGKAVPALVGTLDADDMWLRILAAEALGAIKGPAMEAAPILLKRLATAEPSANDPRGMEQRYLCFALFDRRGGLIGRSIQGVDRDLLLDAVRAGLGNQDGRARGTIGSVYRQLSHDEIEPLLPAVLQAVAEPAPSGLMFADQIRLEGLRVLAQHGVEEGMRAAVDYVKDQNPWGSKDRMPRILSVLVQYGAHAKPFIPELQRYADEIDKGEANQPRQHSKDKAEAIREAIKKIQAADEKPPLIKITSPNA